MSLFRLATSRKSVLVALAVCITIASGTFANDDDRSARTCTILDDSMIFTAADRIWPTISNTMLSDVATSLQLEFDKLARAVEALQRDGATIEDKRIVAVSLQDMRRHVESVVYVLQCLDEDDDDDVASPDYAHDDFGKTPYDIVI